MHSANRMVTEGRRHIREDNLDETDSFIEFNRNIKAKIIVKEYVC